MADVTPTDYVQRYILGRRAERMESLLRRLASVDTDDYDVQRGLGGYAISAIANARALLAEMDAAITAADAIAAAGRGDIPPVSEYLQRRPSTPEATAEAKAALLRELRGGASPTVKLTSVPPVMGHRTEGEHRVPRPLTLGDDYMEATMKAAFMQGMARPPGHPAPWRWKVDLGAEEMPTLIDANGNEVCNFGEDRQYYPSEGVPPTGRAAALMEAAPQLAMELERALLVVASLLPPAVAQLQLPEARALLAQIEERSRG